MGTVFINYRRGDTEGQARALFKDLTEILGPDSVFMDVDNIALGKDFRAVLQDRLATCEMMLVLIGRDWVDAKDRDGHRRLELPSDFVRIEIAAALKRNIPVTPLFLEGAQMPAPEQLPADLADFAFRNGFEISHNRWESDVHEMVRRLNLGKTQENQPLPPTREVRAVPSRKTPWGLVGAATAAVLLAIGIYFVWNSLHDRPFARLGASVRSLAVSQDGGRLLSGSNDLQLQLWDLGTRKLLKSVNAGGEVTGVAFSHDGSRVLSCASRQKKIQLWSSALERSQAFDVDEVLSGSFSPEDNSVLACSIPGATLIDPTTGQSRHFTGGETWCGSGAFLDESRAFLTGRGTSVVLWDFVGGREVRSFTGSPKWVTSLAASPKGKGHFLVTGSEFEPTIRLWDYDTGQQIRDFTGNDDGVLAVAFSSDGHTVFSAGKDRTARAWDRDTGAMRFICRGHGGPVTSVVPTPDGKFIFTGSDDRTIRVWDAASGAPK